MTNQPVFRYFLNTIRAMMELPRDSNSHETLKSLFSLELMALERCTERNIDKSSYERHPDGSTTLDSGALHLDAPSLYLFAHKTLVSGIQIFKEALPHGLQRGLKTKNFTTFKDDVQRSSNQTQSKINTELGEELTWIYNKIMVKRHNMVEHWQTNSANKLRSSVYCFDLPVLCYEDPSLFREWLANSILPRLADEIAERYRIAYDKNMNSDSIPAFLEAIHPALQLADQKRIDDGLNSEIFIALPVTPRLIARVDNFLTGLFKLALQLADLEGGKS